jgi:hypothetical protein
MGRAGFSAQPVRGRGPRGARETGLLDRSPRCRSGERARPTRPNDVYRPHVQDTRQHFGPAHRGSCVNPTPGENNPQVSRLRPVKPDFGQANASRRVPLIASRARRKSSGRESVVVMVMVRGPVRILMCDHRPAARSDLKPELPPYRRKAAARVPAAPWPCCRRSQP